MLCSRGLGGSEAKEGASDRLEVLLCSVEEREARFEGPPVDNEMLLLGLCSGLRACEVMLDTVEVR